MAKTETEDGLTVEVSDGEEDRNKIALILGGGSPHMTLMAGALLAFDEAGLKFDVISTSGAGALIGLLYTAPKNKTPRQALKATVDFGVSDSIYKVLPVNYKAFFKKGRVADLYRAMWRKNPLVQAIISQQGRGPVERWLSDWLQLVLALWCPTDLNPLSKGVCAPVPFIDELVDFEALKRGDHFDGDFYINAYNVTRERLENWGKDEIDKEHFLASLSFPFIYDPTTIDGDLFYEGAAVDCLNFNFLVGKDAKHPDIGTLVVFDIIGNDRLLHKPRNLWDAWGQQIIYPLVEVARDDLKIFESCYNIKKDHRGRVILDKNGQTQPDRKVIRVNFEVPANCWPEALDWSCKNVNQMFEIGQAAGQRTVENELKHLVPAKPRPSGARRSSSRPPA